MTNLKYKVAEELLCALINNNGDNNNGDNNNGDNDRINASLLLENKFEEILDLAVEKMSDDQRVFYEKMINSDEEEDVRYYFLAGLPGTGKSYLQNALHLYFAIENDKRKNYHHRNFLCLAPTNLIAFQQHGFTIHKALRFMCRNLKISNYKTEDELVDKLVNGKYATRSELKDMTVSQLQSLVSKCSADVNSLSKDFLDIKMILIDEGSMVSSLLLTLLSLQFPKGKFIIMYGPNQLPPVNGFLSCDEAFDAKSDETFFHNLQTQMRFNRECFEFNEFVAFFSDCLSGKVSQTEKLAKMKYFFENLSIGGNLDDYRNLSEDKILIVSTNKQRCQENEERLLKEKGDGKIYNIPAIYDAEKLKYYNIESNLGIDKILKITVGVKCIVKCNDLYNGLIKGMVVQVMDIYENTKGEVDSILVKTNSNALINVNRYSFETSTPKNDIIKQFPLALFYSITAHSTQGKTLDCKVGVALRCFGTESLYKRAFFVAVTRIRHPKQLYMDKHPVSFIEPSMSINSPKDIENVAEQINQPSKKQKFDLPVSDFYNVSELMNIVEKKK